MVVKHRTLKTVDDYLKLPDDVRVELIHGEFFVSPSATARHQRVLLNIALLLRAFVRPRALGEVYVAPLDAILATDEVVQPDVLFVARENLGRIRDRLHGPPDLAVEILSPGNTERDRIVKRGLYHEKGVCEYWIVDLDAATVEVLRWNTGDWELHGIFSGDDTLTSPLLVGFAEPVREVFA